MDRIPAVRKATEQQVLQHARRNARRQDQFSRGGFDFLAMWDHIIQSQCSHGVNENAPNCSRCLFNALPLPELPEMLFPQNKLIISFSSSKESYIEFNALDALREVCSDRLPDVQVAPSAVWQSARRGFANCGQQLHPFDWTYTTDYCGTLVGCSTTSFDEPIDLERLKLQEEIGFYSQVTLYEDELADHGCAQLSVRVRVMPNYFFALLRFYLRIDRVLIRVCDTRLVGDNNTGYMTREWSRREAKVEDLNHLAPEVLLDGNQVWSSLPVVRSRLERISPSSTPSS